MGLDIDRHEFHADDYIRFAARLDESLAALRQVLARPGFGAGPPSVGAELELNVVDAEGRPLPKNQSVLASTDDPRVTVEVNRFNLEINTPPTALAGRPFARLGTELDGALAEVRRAAALHGGRVVPIGILPTLRPGDLEPGTLTDAHRYRALSEGLRRLRHEPFRIRIEGEDSLDVSCDSVTFEGASTSLQVHLRVEPAAFARTFNAAQVATGPVLAAAGNSPLFLGRRLWHETRIALFRQAVDERIVAAEEDWRPARVSFGHGWVRSGAWETFAETVALHTPLLPVVGPDDPLALVKRGELPALDELRLHHGTVWRWNRAVYDPSGGGHLRIEMRALPAGPTVPDMLANAGFLVGLTLGLVPRIEEILTRLTFGQARHNFYTAAREGLDAELLWPSSSPSPRPRPAAALVESLLPVAREGLVGVGVEAEDADRVLGVIAARVRRRQTGAIWQRSTLAALERHLPRGEVFPVLLERYLQRATGGEPVHAWAVDP
jgi:gamma-glutamyl:cysteine ligase YbdK (ATP-grasp superfamily)